MYMFNLINQFEINQLEYLTPLRCCTYMHNLVSLIIYSRSSIIHRGLINITLVFRFTVCLKSGKNEIK